MSSSTIINIPTDEKVFESSCVPLFAGLLNDPNVKLVGTRGQNQKGLDLIGKRDRDPFQPVGIQCKLITRGGKLKESVVRDDLTAALTVVPALTEFYVVTTANDSTDLDLLAVTLCQEQAALGRKIDIVIWGWDTLQSKIRADERALAAFDPDYSASTNTLISIGKEAAEKQDLAITLLQGVTAGIARIEAGPTDTERSASLEVHLDMQIDTYRDLMNDGKPRTALDLLLKLEEALSDTSSAAIRARVKANSAFAYLRLGDDEKAANLLAEAYHLNPSDPKTRANYILSLSLQGDQLGAWNFARGELEQNPTNAAAAALVFQTAAMSDDVFDPMTIVPAVLLDGLDVRIHRISYLHAKQQDGRWRELAAETLERFPNEAPAQRLAGEALVDAALSDGVLEKSGSLPLDRCEKLDQGIALLKSYWDVVRKYENAGEPIWITVALNLITAYRAKGDLPSAQLVTQQMLSLGSKMPDTFLVAAQVAIDLDDFSEAARLLRAAPPQAAFTLPLMIALANMNDWSAVTDLADPARAEGLREQDRQQFDALRFRARYFSDQRFELDDEVDKLIERWPRGLAVHITVADIYRRAKPEAVAPMAAKAKSLIDDTTEFSDRVMFAQLSMSREAWDDVIAVLDGHVALDRPSDPLGWLAVAFANAAIRPRTTQFFKSLSPEIIASARYSRLAGAAEHSRGDLKAAEKYLRRAVEADPTDLRAYILLDSTLERDNRLAEAAEVLRTIDDEKVEGSLVDQMRLAYLHRKAGDVTRALRIGYRIAAANRDDEDVIAAYPGLIFLDENIPESIAKADRAAEGLWFDLEGLDGAHDVTGVIDKVAIGSVATFTPEHPLTAALMGKSVGETIAMPGELGERRYRVRDLKHKYIWLLHDILATHAGRFPDATTLIEMRIQDDDVQPVFDFARKMQGRSNVVAELYLDSQLPLSVVAALSKSPVFALAEHLSASGTSLRTCIGAHEERFEAANFVQSARGMGATFDTLTILYLREFGHLAIAREYFGRLCIPQSTLDDFLELRAKIETTRGREYMTLGFEGDQPVRHVHTVEESEAQLAAINELIDDLRQNCEILPVDGSEDVRLENLMGRHAAAQVFDPIHLAKSQGTIFISDDMNLRRYAASEKVIGGAWLHVLFNVLGVAEKLSDHDYHVAVGKLAVMRHDYVWVDALTLVGILTLEHVHAYAFFQAAVRSLGGPKAEMRSHLNVVRDFSIIVWATGLPHWQKERAIGCILTQLVHSRPSDWKAILHVLELELRGRATAAAYSAHDTLIRWIKGHFFDLDEIRSRERVMDELRPEHSMKRAAAAKAERRKKKGRGSA